jgi:hypothetical protein
VDAVVDGSEDAFILIVARKLFAREDLIKFHHLHGRARVLAKKRQFDFKIQHRVIPVIQDGERRLFDGGILNFEKHENGKGMNECNDHDTKMVH